MKCVNYHQALILCLLIIYSPVANTKSKPHRSAVYTYNGQVFPVNGLKNVYTFYVAGDVVTIEIPEEVETNPQVILNWIVTNANENRLIFVSGYRPRILIDKSEVKILKIPPDYLFGGKMIMLGDGKVIHAQVTENPTLDDYKKYPFNYLDLLYFNAEKEEVEIVDSITWLTEDDGKHIGHWRTLAHIFIGDKLYIATGREVAANPESREKQISIMRLCLDKGDAILSSAVEVHFEAGFGSNSHFVYKLGKLDDESKRFSLLVERNYLSLGLAGVYERYFLTNYATIFDQVAANCSKGVYGYSTMHDVVTVTGKGCQAKSVTNCSFPKFYVPSYGINLKEQREPKTMYSLVVVHDGYPFDETRFIFREGKYINECPLSSVNAAISDLSKCIIKAHDQGDRYFFFFNYVTSSLFWLDETGSNFVYDEFNCSRFTDCFSCIMFGYHSKCTWNSVYCTSFHVSSFVNITSVAVNFCSKINNFRPKSAAIGTIPKQIFIDFDGVPWMESMDLKVYVTIGSDSCGQVTKIYEPAAMFKIYCLMDVLELGKFKINLTFAYEHYGNTVPIVAISKDFINFRQSGTDETITLYFAKFLGIFIIVMVFLITAISIFCPCDNKRQKRSHRHLKSDISLRSRSISHSISGRAHKTMDPKLKWKEITTSKGKFSSESLRSGSKY